MKKVMSATALGLISTMLLTGCLNLQFGGGSTTRTQSVTVGQQLVDLKRAKDAGAMTDAEYEAQKNRLLAQ